MYYVRLMSFLSSFFYDAHRWCEGEAVFSAFDASPRLPAEPRSLALIGVMGTIALNPNDPETREAMIRGYTAPRRDMTGESMTVDPNTMLWAGENWNTDNVEDDEDC